MLFGSSRQWGRVLPLLALSIFGALAGASASGEANVVLPDLEQANFDIFGMAVHGTHLLYIGLAICVLGCLYGQERGRLAPVGTRPVVRPPVT